MDGSITTAAAAMVYEDRSLIVPPGRRIVTGYAPIDRVRIANRSRMAIGDVDAAMRQQLALGAAQKWPCPNGRWEGEDFVVHDGRHAFVAALMLGLEHLLVAWLE
ncbi:hypothetical protein [Pseudoroseicyclus aestuarii]|uniref:Uncharacterized protein n=1 Tax=Pseudoroseicyclus aestuarii TaxID=1795041 RepID=A0A318SV39_9RHOB|nr:hypothetical protein [Pseudoroseicyclus aestuarii]PYE84166.1 hypothetical protein DFP88_103534 [Pseudoroseicyclus aestuarii]